MREKAERPSGKKEYPKPTESWFRTDPDAFEIRRICKRIITSYRRFMRSGDVAIGMVPESDAASAFRELHQAYHDLEEFDITPNKLVGKKPEFYYQKPIRMAEYVAGQLIKLQNIPLVTDMERNMAADALNLEDGIADPGQAWPEAITNMRIQVAFVDAASGFLGIK